MNDGSEQQPRSSPRTTRILGSIAAALAFTGATLDYVNHRKIDYWSIGGGLFALSLVFTAGRRR